VSDPVLFLVPARGGSRRLPGKNLRTVAGIPLVGWAARTARRAAAGLAGGPHRIVCSTDDPRIAAAARSWGADTVIDRPAGLASDTASSLDVALHALDVLAREGTRFRALVLVQPISPLADPSDLRAAVERFDAGADSVVSVTRSHPVGHHVRLDDRAGDAVFVAGPDGEHLLTGAFYVVAPDRLRERGRFVVDGTTAGQVVTADRSVDIDDEVDLAYAEGILAARTVRPVPLGSHSIGAGPVVVIAEVGVNHNGNVELAHRLVDAVADSGADVVKFQTFEPAALAAADAPTAEYQREADGATGDQRSMLARLALPTDAWAGLQDHARDRGLLFLSTPFDDASADLLDALDVPAFKIGSGELTNIPFLERCARRGRPLLVSTGMADMVEVAVALGAIEGSGNPPVALLHCVSSYPARVEDANLRAIETMRRAFGVPVGWSDHTPGIELPIAAVAAGASVIEKHVTLDRTLPGPDHRASLEPDELRATIRGIRIAEAALGTGIKEPVADERPIAAVARRSLHWQRDLPAGAVVAATDLIALRPGTGIPPARQADLVDRRTRRPVAAGRPVLPDDVEGLA
jgi:N-acetylneuraminate synthase/N,N'-diacetyllegionaminate synthase